MGTFTFRNKKTGKNILLEGTIAEAEEFEKKFPHMEWLCGTPLIHSGTGMKKPDSNFRDLLTNLKRVNSRGRFLSTINDFGGGKDF